MLQQKGNGCDKKLRKTSKFTPLSNKPTLVHSKAADKPNLHDNMKIIFETSMVIRKSIEKAKEDPWVFNGALESSKDVVPHELDSVDLEGNVHSKN